MGYVNLEIADKYQKLFNFFSKEHSLNLTIGEMDDVIKQVENFKNEY